MKNKTKYLIVTLCILVGFLLAGAAIANAETTDITEIKLTGNYQYGEVPAGILPSFNPGTTTEGISMGTNADWVYFISATSVWSGFGSETPVAYNDGNTKYGYRFQVKTNSGYQLASDLKVIYKGVDVTTTTEVLRWPWGAYIYVDLGKAIGENPATHTVTFNSNGGTEIAPKQVVSGVKITEPSTPTKDKYLFRGWYEDSTFSKEFDFNTPITSDMTLYAKWEAANSIKEIRLAGDVQYGNVPVGTLPSFNPRTTTDNITIDKVNSHWKYKMQTGLWSGFGSETPTAVNDGKTDYGYTFSVKPNDGYQLDYSNLKVFYNEAEVTSTVKVEDWSWGAYVTVNLGKANGTPVVYTITFNSNGGATVTSQNVNAGEKVIEPTPAPTKEGFTFDGWYEDSTFSKKFDFNTPITDSMILYAKWTENKYTLTFNSNGGTGTMTPIANLTGEYTLPANEFTAPSGKQFKGWSLSTDGAIVTKVDMTENKTVYAIWEDIPVVTYTLTFNANGGSGTMAPIANLTGEYTLPANEFTAPSGKQFKGWSLSTDGAIVTKVDMTENKTVYAIWEDIPVVTYTLTFNANGGSGTMTPIADLTGEYTLPSNGFTAPSGKQFKGWSLTTDGETVTKVNMTENRTVYAIWEDIPVVTYTLTFDANGGTGTMAAKTGLTGEYTLPTNEFTAPSGKQFKGWSLTADGAIVTKVDMTENKTVYAIWEDIPVVTYTLTFDANSGSGTMAPIAGLTGEYTLPANGFTAPSGKQFKGWSLTTDGAIVTKVDMTENRTVYAIWTNIGGGGASSSGGGGGFYVPTTQKPEIKAAAGGKAELSKDGTTLTITADAGKVIDKVLLNGKDMGAVSELKGLKTGDKVEVIFKDQVTEPTKEELDKAAKEAAGDLVLTARSAKLKNGSVKVMLKGDLKAITDAGYTVKYKFYRSTKKSAGYKAVLTKKAPTYFNTYGKKGTMYYYKARVMIYDKDGNFVAQTALKQCKYANRLWTK